MAHSEISESLGTLIFDSKCDRWIKQVLLEVGESDKLLRIGLWHWFWSLIVGSCEWLDLKTFF